MGSKGRAGALQLPIDLPGSCERQWGPLGAALWVLRAYFPLNARSGTPNEILNHQLGEDSESKDESYAYAVEEEKLKNQ